MIEADKKREQIIDGAIKRFIHFGINKTTMNDIAEDLSVSKPSLYYYFPDKKSLILGVIEKVFTDFFEHLNKKRNPNLDLNETLLNIIDIRTSYFKKYFMLKISDGLPDLISDENIKEKLEGFKENEVEIYCEIFTAALNKGEITSTDIRYTSELYLKSLVGLSHLCLMACSKDIIPDKKMIHQMVTEQKDLSIIFVKGLKC
ncbi:TetR/AcrR family transcriptional regulator [Pedobacter sp. MW01-1-1]|uniref:TetR/AcrR family transcriptional regulator n=1 Tax=Pedobacter sp. MW01-1-1 TaxID=3383027 RepID=UPI003FEFA6B0